MSIPEQIAEGGYHLMAKKRISILAAVLLVVLGNRNLAYAGTMERAHSTDLKEIQEISDEILEFANDCYADLYTGESASVEDLDYANAYMVYTDADIFTGEAISEENLEKKLEVLPVVWCIPVSYEDVTGIVEVSRGLPLREDNLSILTDEQIAEIRNKEGKWTVSSAGFEETNRQQEAEDLLADDTAEITLLGGVPGVSGLVALVKSDQGLQGVMPLNDSGTLKKGSLYLTEEFSAVAQKEAKNQKLLAASHDGDAGGDISVNVYGVAGLLLIAAVIAFGVCRYYGVH